MKCIDKECEHRELNGGDDISDFYFCKECGISVDRGEDECLFDEWDSEEYDHPCTTCESRHTCDGWEAQFCCTLCYYYDNDPDCENCDPMDI